MTNLALHTKRGFLWLLLFPLAALLSCQDGREAEIIEKAENIVGEHPDSALALLQTVDDPGKLSEDLTMRYWIATGQAHLNLSNALTEDSMPVKAIDYYRKRNDPDRAAQAERLAAQYYWWKGDKREAYRLLRSSMQNAAERNDSANVRRAALKLASLAACDNDYPTAKECLQSFLANCSDPQASLAISRDIAIAHFYSGRPDSSRLVFENLLTQAAPSDSAMLWDNIISDYTLILSATGEIGKAIDLQKKVPDHAEGRNSELAARSYSLLCQYYLQLGDTETAGKYLQLADSTYTEHNDLSDIAHKRIMHILLDYAQSRKIDSKQLLEFTNELMDNEFRQTQITLAKEQARRRLAERNLRQETSRRHYQILLSAALLFLAALACLFVGYAKRKRRIIAEKQDELDTLRTMASESGSSIDENDSRFFKKIMLQQLGVIQMAAANPTAANQEMIKRMAEITNKDVATETLLDWDTLYRTIDFIYDGFHSKTAEKFGHLLTDKEMQLCCLLKANFQTKEISVVTQQSVRTVYQRKSVIRQKLQMEEAADIAEFLSK